MISSLKIDSASPVALHVQVEQIVRRLARLPAYRGGALFPNELMLARQLGLSRGTVRAAILRLVHEGLLERRAGIGTRLAPRQAESGLGEWRSFSREMGKKGIDVENYLQTYALIGAEEEVAAALRLKPGTKLYRLDRVRGWDDLPVLHSRSWFHPRLGLTGRERFDRPLYEVLRREAGVVADHAHESFRAVAAPAAMAKALQVRKGEPLLWRCHLVYDPRGRAVEFCEIHYVSSRFTLTVEMRRGRP